MNDRVTRRLADPSRTHRPPLPRGRRLPAAASAAADNLGPSQAVAQGGAAPAGAPHPSRRPRRRPTPAAPRRAGAGALAGLHPRDVSRRRFRLLQHLLPGVQRRAHPGIEGLKTVPARLPDPLQRDPARRQRRAHVQPTWPVWQVGPAKSWSAATAARRSPPPTRRSRTGVMSARCIVDGVRSGWIVLTITDR